MSFYREKPDLYVGCSLTHAPEDFKENVEATKVALGKNWEVMQFLGLTNGTAEDVYEQDIVRNVGGCDAFVGICDHPSIGLGWELSTATTLGKPTLALAHKDTKLTRLILGAPAFNPTMRVIRYEDMIEEVPAIVAEEFGVVRDVVRLRKYTSKN